MSWNIFFRKRFRASDSKKPTDKKKIAQEILNVIKDISNPVEQSHWIKVLSGKIGTEEKVLMDVLKKAKSGEIDKELFAKERNEKGGRENSFEKNILGIILAFPNECRSGLSKIHAGDFQNEKEKAIIEAIKKDKEKFSLEKVKALFLIMKRENFGGSGF